MVEQARQVLRTQRGQGVFGVLCAAALGRSIAHKQVGTAFEVDQRLVQVPTAGHDVIKRWAAHEARPIPCPAQGLAHPIAKTHHVVGRTQGVGGREHGLDLAGAELNFQRQQGQAHALGGVLHDAQGFVGGVAVGFAEQGAAGVDQVDLGWWAWPRGLVGVSVRPGAAHSVDVKLHLQAALHAPAFGLQLGHSRLQHPPAVPCHGCAVLEPRLAWHPTHLGGPGQGVEFDVLRQQGDVVALAKAVQAIGAPGFKHFESGAV